ncbi:MAG: 2-amino-4-hydroxy-6-hydroxymethyldihydropteridine diphosphokinase [Cytophagales bacterium]|nr:2-amino-4-hydroxy-6-hydroxymethyldihydropteridine diphosphokinase [Cytophagales bacterium]
MSGRLLLLGTNLGDKRQNFERALDLLAKKGVGIIKQSSIYESEPWGIADQPWFWNMVIEVKTSLLPTELLKTCLKIENEMGRVRKQKWGERLIDIDILYFDDRVIKEPTLELPHPGIPDRIFTLLPLVEKWPELIHPIFKKSQKELLSELSTELECRKSDVVLGQ